MRKIPSRLAEPLGRSLSDVLTAAPGPLRAAICSHSKEIYVTTDGELPPSCVVALCFKDMEPTQVGQGGGGSDGLRV